MLPITVSIGLLLFGIGYAYRIAIRPFPARRTWVSVVIGDAVTDIGSFLLIWHFTGGNWLIALAPVASHVLTGLPMILGQLLKHHFETNAANDLVDMLNGNGE